MRIDRYVSVSLRTSLKAKQPISLGPGADYVTVPKNLLRKVATEAKKAAGCFRDAHVAPRSYMLWRMAFRFREDASKLNNLWQHEKEREIGGLQGGTCLVLGAANLLKPVFFHVGPCVTFQTDAKGEPEVIGLQPGEWGIPDTLWRGSGNPPIIDRGDLPNIRRHYSTLVKIQSGNASRLQVVLRFYLRTLLTSDADLSYLLHWQTLEALFPAEHAETTHQLCERAASIISRLGSERQAHYRNLKRLYGRRSDLVHGRKCKFGSEHHEMAEYLRLILKAIFANLNHMTAFTGKDKRLRDYLLGVVLGGDYLMQPRIYQISAEHYGFKYRMGGALEAD